MSACAHRGLDYETCQCVCSRCSLLNCICCSSCGNPAPECVCPEVNFEDGYWERVDRAWDGMTISQIKEDK